MSDKRKDPREIVIAISGASGTVYGTRLCEVLSKRGEVKLDIVVSDGAKLVMDYETGGRAATMKRLSGCGRVWDERDLFAPFASGSNAPDAYVVAPCSMKTLSAIATGYSHNLLCRGAEVALKQRRRLVILPREMPFTDIQMENMLRLSRAGATIMPPQPAFYNKPKGIDDMVDFVVGRVLDAIGIENDLYRRWDSGK